MLLLIAYVFDLTSPKTKVPSVILLLLLGWSVRQVTIMLDLQLPDYSPFLQVIGPIGLILIVLEGALDIKLNKTKFGLIQKSFFGALIQLLVLSSVFAYAFNYFGNYGIKDSLTNAIPLCVISSAVAIPSVRNLSTKDREFVIYESSLCDIFGVLIFNFLVLNETINALSFLHFGLQLLVIVCVSIIATFSLSYFLGKIEHHIKFIPIILIVVLIYEVSKIFHLPGLIFILIFGLSIGNFDRFRRYKWIEKIKTDDLDKEVTKFRELVTEGTFLIRAVFFILFGFLIETNEVLNTETFYWAAAIVLFIFGFRTVQLLISKLPLFPLLFIAPRGLITILLFISIEPNHTISFVNPSLIIQVIILTALIMMVGLISFAPHKSELHS